MKYFLGFLASIALVILVIFLVIRGISGGGSDEATSSTKLVSYADTATTVSFDVDGPINADELHNAYRIIVGRDEVILETFKGYEEEVIERQEFENNETSYANFLRALDLAGFSKGTTEGSSDPRGQCADENRFVLKIENGSSEMQDFWTTTCGGGTFKGDISQVRQLFHRQVPDVTRVIRKLNIFDCFGVLVIDSAIGAHRDEAALQFVAAQRSHFKTALLSNISQKGLEYYFTDSELAAYFDTAIATHEEQATKPAVEAFLLVIDR
jgi:hypothetical protein